ncbi:MAG: branched-chain amino acid ABC transporter permease, partial [Myxococcales bacterium]|nr:branched-chain amino acid ABC transporter permease [Myxococcales bacterium]
MDLILQQLLIGITNGMVFALIALGYSMVYGVLELINFAHGDLFMLAGFLALTLLGAMGASGASPGLLIVEIIAVVAACSAFGALVNVGLERVIYRPLRGAPKLAPLVSAIGISFIFQNLGLFWGALPMAVFGDGAQAAAPKAFPDLIPNYNLFGETASFRMTPKDLVV